ncbi:MAG TPA: histidinol-phosphatase [Candidatus Binatia bacterium]|jgi:histidinol phosphatase-like enzyme (inositol monophosphatase family)|nr:histidinol-phosphatase [Candidatus Binatia bacterium]
MAEPQLAELLAVAQEAAWVGGRRTLAYFNTGTANTEWKADTSPVTKADREAERLMRDLIGRAFPDHAILGEEEGETAGTAPYRWILDPLDGTRTFVRGVPLYGTLVGLEAHGEPVVGVVYMPALDEMVSAAHGLGCRWNGRICRVSSTTTLDDALLCVTDERMARARSGAFDRLAATVPLQRTWADCYAYVLVATGRAEIAMDPIMNVWDCAALLPIVEEAGGRFTDWKGTRTIHGNESVATNGHLHSVVLEHLRGG